MANASKLALAIGGIAVLVTVFVILQRIPFAASSNPAPPNENPAPGAATAVPDPTPIATSTPATATSTPQTSFSIFPPLPNAVSRATKVTFGLYVSPGHSPISPERFTGYHTGVDFETTPAEQDIDVHVSTVCSGPLLVKEWASGYGGVAVQKCTIANQAVTVIYGHLRESSITPKVGEQVTAGQEFAVLGTGYSQETDGERKHLHLGIHKGTGINILGYVQNKADLSGWLNALDYLH